MQQHIPFPEESAFAWTFYLVLMGFLAVASYLDITRTPVEELRRKAIPKWLTLTLLGLGVLFNIVRGAWMGWDGAEVWALGENGAFVGALDGLLFALAGFATGFGLFFLMWILGVCGGGDVKLFAALGAWVGAEVSLWVLGLTLILICVIAVLRLAASLLTRGYSPTVKDYTMKGAHRSGKKAGKQGYAQSRQTRRRLTPYSLPVALSTAILLFWFVLSYDLGLRTRHPEGDDKPKGPRTSWRASEPRGGILPHPVAPLVA